MRISDWSSDVCSSDLQPLLGTLSDRIGRRTNLLIFSGGMTLFAVPLFGALARVQTMLAAVLLVFAALAILSFYTTVSGLFHAKLFTARVRTLGLGLGPAIAPAIFDRTSAYVGLLLRPVCHDERSDE